jgi:beta-glucanase (GH16 family)
MRTVGGVMSGVAVAAMISGVAAGAEQAAAVSDSVVADESGKPGAVPEGYRLVWSQEFDGAGDPDPAVWVHEEGFKRNNELQWYRRENATLEDGMLVIEGRRERVANPGYEEGSGNWRKRRRYAEYTSASLTTRGTHEWRYGVFEMRAKIDIRDGLWPAWWSLGSARPWPGCGEIDMMEYYQGVVLANACWKKKGDRWAQHWDSSKTPVGELDEGGDPETAEADWAGRFHTWRMVWTADAIELSCDGVVLNTIDVTKTWNPDGSNPFREPHFMLVNLAIGGNQGGDPSATEFPSRYEIDYIRVYQDEADLDTTERD